MKTFLRSLVPAVALCLSASALIAGTISNDLGASSLIEIKNGKAESYDAAALGDVKLFAIYYSAQWCPPCRAFTPELVEFYNRTKKNHPEFELIFVSNDKTESAMARYMTEYRMKFPGLKYGHSSIVTKHGGRGIPNLVLVDANNKVLKDSFEQGEYVGPQVVLADLQKRLSKAKSEAQKNDAHSPFKTKEVNVFSR